MKKKIFKCPECDSVVNDSDKHCIKCGSEFKSVSDAASDFVGTFTNVAGSGPKNTIITIKGLPKDKSREELGRALYDGIYKAVTATVKKNKLPIKEIVVTVDQKAMQTK